MADVLDVACFYCGARPGKPCKTKSKKPVSYIHASRTEAWVQLVQRSNNPRRKK